MTLIRQKIMTDSDIIRPILISNFKAMSNISFQGVLVYISASRRFVLRLAPLALPKQTVVNVGRSIDVDIDIDSSSLDALLTRLL